MSYEQKYPKLLLIFQQSACVNNRCSSKSRCQTGFTDRGYRCVCSAGFTGEYCDKGNTTFHEFLMFSQILV